MSARSAPAARALNAAPRRLAPSRRTNVPASPSTLTASTISKPAAPPIRNFGSHAGRDRSSTARRAGGAHAIASAIAIAKPGALRLATITPTTATATAIANTGHQAAASSGARTPSPYAMTAPRAMPGTPSGSPSAGHALIAGQARESQGTKSAALIAWDTIHAPVARIGKAPSTCHRRHAASPATAFAPATTANPAA